MKSRWQETGHHQFMDSSRHVPQSNMLMGIVAMNLGAQHHIARGREPNLKLCGGILIRPTRAQLVICINMLKIDGKEKLLAKLLR